jgi:hypothetical protein
MSLHLKSTGLSGGNFGAELDDYEEGAWSPNFSTWSPGPSVVTARYIKIGLTVGTWQTLNDGGTTLSGGFWNMCTGLPFSPAYDASGSIVSHTHNSVAHCCINASNDTWQIQGLVMTQYGWDVTMNYISES